MIVWSFRANRLLTSQLLAASGLLSLVFTRRYTSPSLKSSIEIAGILITNSCSNIFDVILRLSQQTASCVEANFINQFAVGDTGIVKFALQRAHRDAATPGNNNNSRMSFWQQIQDQL